MDIKAEVSSSAPKEQGASSRGEEPPVADASQPTSTTADSQSGRGSSGRKRKRSSARARYACINCKSAKVRCVWPVGDTMCQRCKRMNKTNCTISKPKRIGRRNVGERRQAESVHVTDKQREWFVKSFEFINGDQKLTKPHKMNNMPLDMCQLYYEVQARGGFEAVKNKEGGFTDIFGVLENYSPSVSDASYRLKKLYEQYLLKIEWHVGTSADATASANIGTIMIDTSDLGNHFNLQIPDLAPPAAREAEVPGRDCSEAQDQPLHIDPRLDEVEKEILGMLKTSPDDGKN